MATTDNPLDPNKTADTGLLGLVTDQPTSGSLPSNVGTTAPTMPNAATYAPTTRNLNKATDTVQGQLDSILSTDSPLMQRARTMASQTMNGRGLLNSTMNTEAGVGAMIDRATPIAQQDASINNQVASENMNARNMAGQFNAGELNRFGLQRDQQAFASAQAGLDRAQQTSLQNAQNAFNMRMQELQESGLDFRQARDIASREQLQKDQQGFAGAQAGLDRAQQINLQNAQNAFNLRMQELQESGLDFRQARDIASREQLQREDFALKTKQFNAEQFNAERRLILQNQAEFDRLGLQIKASSAQIPSNFAAQISSTAMTGVNAIMADANLSADAKKSAIDNLVGYANAQISWAAKFYGTSIPAIGTPSSPTTLVYNPTAPSASAPVSGTSTTLNGGPAYIT